MQFTIRYTLVSKYGDGNYPAVPSFSLVYSNGSRGYPSVYPDPYPLAPYDGEIGSEYELATITVPQNIPDGGQIGYVPSSLDWKQSGSGAFAYGISGLSCSAGKINWIAFYGCNNCDPG